MNSKMTDNKTSSGLWKKTGMLAATIFVSHMAFTSGAFSPSSFAPVAQAQPDLNNAPKGENPPPRDRPNRPNRGDKGNHENRRNPEDNVRQMLTQAGVNDTATQTAILDYVKADMEARGPLREQGKSLYKALQAGAVTDDQLSALVTDYRAAQQAEKTRHEQAQGDLDAKINYSENPRLEAMLLLSGLIGDGPMMFQGGGRGPGERGGRGGQPGAKGQGNPMTREERQKKMLERYDTNKDGKLDDAEKADMKEENQKRREQRQNGGKTGAAPAPAPAPADAMQDKDDA